MRHRNTKIRKEKVAVVVGELQDKTKRKCFVFKFQVNVGHSALAYVNEKMFVGV
jgi:hypothetical protein